MRPLRRRLLQGTLLTILVIATVYSVLAWRYWSNPPVLSRNFAAELNAPIEKFPADQRAWPAYREAILEIQQDAPRAWRDCWDFRHVISDKEASAYLRSRETALAKARRASRLPSLGYLLASKASGEDRRLNYCTQQPEIRAQQDRLPPEKPDENPNMMGVLLIPIGESSPLFLALQADACLAAAEGDGARMLDDLLTIIRVAEHLREIPFVVNDLRATRFFTDAIFTWGRLLERHPELFTAERLQQLEEAAQRYSGGTLQPRYFAERFMFYDVIQRAYSDDGNGDGFLLPTELRNATGEGPEADLWLKASAPLTTWRFHSRRESVETYDRLADQIEREIQQPYWKANFDQSEVLYRRCATERYLLIVLLAPQGQAAHATFEEATHIRDAILAASAVHRYRLDKKAWPPSLDALVPKYLAAVPVDRLDGKPLRYVVVDDRPRLYSIGLDGKDDGGEAAIVATDDLRDGRRYLSLPWHFNFRRFKNDPPDGDLIMWPVEPERPDLKRPKFDEFGVPIPDEPQPTDDRSSKN